MSKQTAQILQTQLQKLYNVLLIDKYPTLFDEIVVFVKAKVFDENDSILQYSTIVNVSFKKNELNYLPAQKRIQKIKEILGIEFNDILYDYFYNIAGYVLPTKNADFSVTFDVVNLSD